MESDTGFEPAHQPWKGRMLPLHQSDIRRKKQSRFAYATHWPYRIASPQPIREQSGIKSPDRACLHESAELTLPNSSSQLTHGCFLLPGTFYSDDCPFTVTGLLLIAPLWAFPIIQSTALGISFHQRGLSWKAISRCCLQNGKRQVQI